MIKARRVPRETLEPREIWDLKVSKALPELKAPRVSKALPEHRA